MTQGSNKSLNDAAVSALAEIANTRNMLAEVNDYGDPTGYREELDQIINDAYAQLDSLRARAVALLKRHRKNRKPPAHE